jgi:hypothetical protein
MNKKEGIPFDGFGSVLEMLRQADGAFREKILGNLRRRDPELAHRLEAHLKPRTQSRSHNDDSRAVLERSQRSAHTRNYGH